MGADATGLAADETASYDKIIEGSIHPPIGTDRMTVQQLRAAHRATPFKPFNVQNADGRSFHVPHPDFLSMSPTGRTVIIYEQNEDFSILDLLLMTEIQTPSTPSSTPRP